MVQFVRVGGNQDVEVDLVAYATCRGCVAGTDGSLCSHVLALLVWFDKLRTKSPSVTSLPRSWGPRQRNIDPEPVSQVVVEKATESRKGDPIRSTLYDARAPRLRNFDMGRYFFFSLL